MINSKYFDRVLAVLLAFALATVILLKYFPNTLSIASTDPITFDYETQLFDKNKVMSINIVVDEDEWNTMLDQATLKEYISGDIEINGETFYQVGIRPKGNTSLSTVASDDTTDRFSFKVEFDHYLDQTCYGLDKLALNNIISDATYMKEYLSYDLLTYMGIPTSLFSYAEVSVNGEVFGLYLAVEVPEESYAERNFGSSYGDLYKPESTDLTGGMGGNKGDVFELSEDKLEEFKNMFNNGGNGQNDAASNTTTNDTADATTQPSMNQPDNATTQPSMNRPEGFSMGGMFGSGSGTNLVYTGDDLDNYSAIWDSSVFDTTKQDYKRIVEALEQISEGNLDGYLDVDTMLRYIAVNSVLVNYDSYFGSLQHNYYLYEKNGQLTMLPWDYNLSFAGFMSNDATSAVNDPIDTPVSGTSLEDRPLVGQVLAVDENVEQYHEYLSQIVSEYFDSGYWEEEIERVDALISEYVQNDPTAFYSYEEYKTGVENLKEFGLLRAQSITGQLNGIIPSTTEAQNTNKENLIDASHISITAMGTQGGGAMGGNGKMDFGNMMPPGGNQMFGQNPWGNTETPGETTEGSAQGDTDDDQMQLPGGMSEEGQQMQPPSGMTEEGQQMQPPSWTTEDGQQMQPPGGMSEDGQQMQPPSGMTQDGQQMQPPSWMTGDGQQMQPPNEMTEDGSQMNQGRNPQQEQTGMGMSMLPDGSRINEGSMDIPTLIWNLSWIVLAMIAVIFVKLYKRRKY